MNRRILPALALALAVPLAIVWPHCFTAEGQGKALDLLTASLQKTFRDAGHKEITLSETKQQTFGKVASKAALIHYAIGDRVGHSVYVYLLTGEKFTCSCIVQ